MQFRHHKTEEDSDINLTPLIDVVFLLLIFFMVSTTFDTNAQLKIQLPEASDQPPAAKAPALNIHIDARGRFFLNAQELSSHNSEALMAAIERNLSATDRQVIIQSDAESPVQSLVTAMDVVSRLGLQQVSIATTRPIQ